MDDVYYQVEAVERESCGHQTTRHTERIRVYSCGFYKLAPDVCHEADFMARHARGYYLSYTDRWVTPAFLRDLSNRDFSMFGD